LQYITGKFSQSNALKMRIFDGEWAQVFSSRYKFSKLDIVIRLDEILNE
jgi:hypothetical protein